MKTTFWMMTVGLCLTGVAHANDTCRMEITSKDQGGIQHAFIHCSQSADEPSKSLSIVEGKEYLLKLNYEVVRGTQTETFADYVKFTSQAGRASDQANTSSRAIVDPSYHPAAEPTRQEIPDSLTAGNHPYAQSAQSETEANSGSRSIPDPMSSSSGYGH